jgi:hypothetical protein
LRFLFCPNLQTHIADLSLTRFPNRSIYQISEIIPFGGDLKMASNRKKTETVRERKKKPNKRNMKKNQERIQTNVERLRELASET